MPAPARHRSSASPLAAAFAVLVLYASLYPFTGWRWPPGQTLPALLALPWPRWVDVPDLWFNALGYLPLGALAMVAARRSGWGPAGAAALALVGPAAMSYATEVTQHFLPGRHPSLKDWVMNCTGAAAGAAQGAALHAAGAMERWHALRERWFVRRSAGALALLALWPLGLLFPAPVPLGLGQVLEQLLDLFVAALDGVPWAEPALAVLLSYQPPVERLGPLGEGAVTALGLLGPCLLAYSVCPRGWRRLVLVAGALALGAAGMTLSTLLNFGPQHALAWATPGTGWAMGVGAAAAASLAPAGRRLSAALGLLVLAGGAMAVQQAPADPYFAQTLQDWEQGRFVRFHGLAQWIGWLWPFAAIGWLLTRLSARGE